MRGRLAAALCVAATSAILVGNPARACATNHVVITLSRFPEEAVSSMFYWASEDAGVGFFAIRAWADDCTPQPAVSGYEATDETAELGTDYSLGTGEIVGLSDPTHGPNDTRDVPVLLMNDLEPEPVVETFDIALRDPVGGYLSYPSNAAMYVIDDDGEARVSLDGTNRSLSESYAHFDDTLGVPVFRAGNVDGTTTVNYTIKPTGKKPALANKDYRAAAKGSITLAAGDRVELIPFRLIDDARSETDETFLITITGAEGAEVVEPKATTFAIEDNEESIPPTSVFHHPRQGWTYEADDYKIREIHIFTDDNDGSGVIKLQIAIRQNLAGGSCAWYNGNDFVPGDCSRQKWLPTEAYERGYFYYYPIEELEPSVGSPTIDNYTAFSRATDAVGNAEPKFKVGQNENTFEIKEPG